jgi:hypothetical protein
MEMMLGCQAVLSLYYTLCSYITCR